MFATTGKSTRKSQESTDYVLEMAGIVAPTGFFDPAGLSRMKTVAQLKYSRESELKHGRVAMLAALGFPFAEEFHPWGRPVSTVITFLDGVFFSALPLCGLIGFLYSKLIDWTLPETDS